MTFHIWYANGKESEGHSRYEWEMTPRVGVLAVASRIGWRDGVSLGRYCNGSDWYWWTETGVDGGQSSDQRGAWVEYDGPPEVWHDAKRGVWTDDETMKRVHAAMLEWMG